MSTHSAEAPGRIPTEQRRRLIVHAVQQQGAVTTESLAARFGVSYMTIWRDITRLEQEGKIARVRGGALPMEGDSSAEPPYTRKRLLHREQKESIARYAAQELVDDGDILILEAGTTVAAMVKYLHRSHLTLITNGVDTVNEAVAILPQVTVLCCGGILRDVAHTFVGPQAEQFFHNVRARTLFLGASGLAFPEGITDPSPLEIQVKRAMAASAERIVLLVDSTKFGVRSLTSILPLERVAILVTDASVPDQYRAQLEEMGIDVRVAGHR